MIIAMWIGIGFSILLSGIAIYLSLINHTHEVASTIESSTVGDALRRQRREDRLEKVIIGETMRGRK